MSGAKYRELFVEGSLIRDGGKCLEVGVHKISTVVHCCETLTLKTLKI